MSPTATPGERSIWASPLLALIVLGLVASSVYVNTLANGFVFDDHAVVVDNLLLRDWSNIPRLFQAAWRPIKRLTLMVDYHLWGLEPAGYHASNVLFHVLVTLALWQFVRVARGGDRLAFVTGLLFALHPVNTEAVAVISHRKEMLGALFLLLALIVHARRLSTARALPLIYLLFVATLLSKEVIGAALPGLLLGYDILARTEDRRRHLLRTAAMLLPLGLGAAVLLAGRLAYQGRQSLVPFFSPDYIVAITGGELSTYAGVLATVCRNFWIYLRILCLPIDLCAERSHAWAHGFLEPATLLAVAGIAACGLAVWRLRSRAPLVAFGLAWVPLGLLPASNVVPLTPWFLAERFLYLPAAGFCLALAGCLLALAQLLPRASARVWPVAALTLAVAIPFAAISVARNRDWKDDVTLWTVALKVNPESLLAHAELARVAHRSGDLAGAALHYETILRRVPDDLVSLTNLGEALAALGQLDEAIEVLGQAVERYPDDGKIHNNLGNCLLALGQLSAAEREYRLAEILTPNIAQPSVNLGVLRARADDVAGAARSFERALSIDERNLQAHMNLALLLASQGQRAAAAQHFRRVLELDPPAPLRERAARAVGQDGGAG